MSETIQAQLVLGLRCANGKNVKVNIRSPAESLTAETIKQVMDGVILLGVVCDSSGSTVQSLVSAQLVRKKKQSVNVSIS